MTKQMEELKRILRDMTKRNQELGNDLKSSIDLAVRKLIDEYPMAAVYFMLNK